ATHLGTPPTGVRGEALARLEDGYKVIREAPGSAATASLKLSARGDFMAYITVVTCNDSPDVFAEARRQLEAADQAGFAALQAENAAWYAQLYDAREEGRLFVGESTTAASESIPPIFQSWTIRHGGSNKPDPRRF